MVGASQVAGRDRLEAKAKKHAAEADRLATEADKLAAEADQLEEENARRKRELDDD